MTECLILLITMHHERDVKDNAKKKPEIIASYNKIKSAVDLWISWCCQTAT